MTVKEVVDTVKEKTSEAAQLAKLKSKISKEKSSIKAKYMEIGEAIYEKYTSGGTVDLEFVDKLDEIKSCNMHIQELNQAITELKMQ